MSRINGLVATGVIVKYRSGGFLLFFALLSIFFISGCVTIKKKWHDQKKPRVIWSISFIGNKNVSSSQILEAIESAPTPLFVKLTRLKPFGNFEVVKSNRVLRSDIKRIKQLYRYYGFYNVRLAHRFKEIVLADSNAYRSYKRVRLELKISEGKQVKVRKISIELLPKSHPAKAFVLAALKKKRHSFTLREGSGFSTPKYRILKGQLLKFVQDLNFATAKVWGHAFVDKEEETARIELKVRLGPRCSFGKIRIFGTERVDPRLLRHFFTFKTGEPYRIQALVDTQRILSALGLFVTVDFKPQLKDIEDNGNPACSVKKRKKGKKKSQMKLGLCPVDIHLELSEDYFRLVKAGLGAVVDGQRNQIEANLGLTFLNFLGGLRKLELNARPGIAVLPNVIQPFDVGPDITASAKFTQPIFSKYGAELGARVLYRYAAQVGLSNYQTISPSTWFSISLLRHLRLRLSWNFEIAIDVQNPATLERENYFLDYFEPQLVLDLRDDPLKTHKGFFFSLTLQGAGIFGKFAYFKMAPEMRIFLPLPFLNAVLAWRVQYGVMFSKRKMSEEERARFEMEDALLSADDKRMRQIARRSPLTQRFFAGGANSVRGWTDRYLGPLACQVRSTHWVERGSSSSLGDKKKQGAIRLTRSRETKGRVVSGAGQAYAGPRCAAEAGEIARSRFQDLANQRSNLPHRGYHSSSVFPRDRILQVVPMGGEQLFVSSLELRIPLAMVSSNLGVVLFTDAGLVQSEAHLLDDKGQFDLRPSLSMGGGIRYFTIIGAIRFDVAFRVAPQHDRYPLQPDWLFHFSIGEAF